MPAPIDHQTIPGDLNVYAHAIERAARQAAVFKPTKGALKTPPVGDLPAMGYTHWLGLPDIPENPDFPIQYCSPGSPLDGPTFWLQVNLEEIPWQARNCPELPAVGVLWVFLDLTGDWKGITYFDSRPAKAIEWKSRPIGAVHQYSIMRLVPVPSETVEVFESMKDMSLMDEYWEYANKLVPRNVPYFGGYAWGIQSDQESTQDTIFCTMHSPVIGDNGALYVHYSEFRGWWVTIESH